MMAADPTPQQMSTAPTRAWATRVGRAIVAAGPIIYFGWLLGYQVYADWPVFAEPRLDLQTGLALGAAAYIGLLLLSYWRKPPALADRHDWRAVLTTAL